MAAYALAVFLSAFLLFQLQPVIGKFILPWFGGGAAVWTVCLLFFQLALLGGYLWAHLLRRLLPAAHRRVHVGLLAASLVFIPVLPDAPALDEVADNPALGILLLLLLTVGLPYVCLASTGPLLQSWFADRYPGRSPYRLYALSNVGSLLGLLTYPVLVEPALTRGNQAIVWSALYLALALLLALLGLQAPSASRPAAGEVARGRGALPWRQLPTWLLLSGCAAALLMAVTNHLSQEVAVVPFLWVIPLALYLISFIITFDSDRWYDRRAMAPLLVISVVAGVWSLGQGLGLDLRLGIVIWSGLLLVCCVCCHGELARRKPGAEQLTLFYLALAAGGALGGLAVGVLAPVVFDGYWELHVGLALAVALIVGIWARELPVAHPRARVALSLALGAAHLVLVGFLLQDMRQVGDEVVMSSRSFYGTLRVTHRRDLQYGDTIRLYHGQTRHGVQFVDPERQMVPTSYYGGDSGLGMGMAYHPRRDQGGLRIGVVGLGTGTAAAYGGSGDRMRFWELDPDVERVARSAFTYLDRTAAEVDVVLGDARQRMQEELRRDGEGRYDLLAVDAFSSDAIPVHLLTSEAFDVYWQLLAPDGLLVLHISNRFVDLEPVVRAAALRANVRVTRFRSSSSSSRQLSRSTWLVLTRPDNAFTRRPEVVEAARAWDPGGDRVLWTDDFASLWPVLDFD